MIRLVLVDDDPDLLESLSDYLQNSFEIVGTGKHGLEAVSLFEEKHPDIVITDLSMPEYDGHYAIEKIRQIDPNAKIIVLTGYDTHITDSIPKYTPNETISKPISLKKLVQTIQTLFDKKTSQMDIHNEKNLNLENPELIRAHELKAIGDLAGRIAHDIRNPLMVIKTNIELLKENESIREVENYRFTKIDDAINRINHQIEDVLNFVKPKPLLLKQTSILNLLQISVQKIPKSEYYSFIFPENDFLIECDPEQLEIVFVNLTLNGIQAMGNSGQIDFELDEVDECVLIKIHDSGPGIPKEKLTKIFDPLFTTRQIGTGLGLPTCKAITEKHDGTIDVQTSHKLGTSFILKLPKCQSTKICLNSYS